MKSSSLLKLSTLGLSSEQMAAVLAVLAEELAPMEGLIAERDARLARDRARKIHGPSKENPRNIHGTSTEIPRLARDGDIISNLPQEKNIIPPFPPSAEPDGLVAFLETYPRREGNNDHGSAAKAYAAALKRTDAETLLACAKAYAEFCKASGKTGTQYVKNCRTWLNDNLWKEWMKKAVQASIPVKIIREGTPEWEELKKSRPRLVARDIQTPAGIIRGEYGRAA